MKSSFMHRLFWGIVPIVVGVVFLLNHAGVITMSIGEFFSTYWPAFVILFGFQGMLLQHGVFWWNPMVMLVGIFFLGRNLEWFDWELSEVMPLVWPVVLILFGLSMIFRGNRRRGGGKSEQEDQWKPITPPPIPPSPPPGPPPAPPAFDEFEPRTPPPRPEEPDFRGAPPPPPEPPRSFREQWKENQRDWKDQWKAQKHEWKDHWKAQKHEWKAAHRHNTKHHGHDWKAHQHDWKAHQHDWKAHGREWNDPNGMNHSRFIGDIYMGNEYWELRPMSISHFIGDTTLDLTKAQIPAGETRIYVSGFIGDVKVFVPNDMGVGIQVTSSCLIGDVTILDQKRGGIFNSMTVETPYYTDTEKRVVLIVSCFIGDVRVTKVG